MFLATISFSSFTPFIYPAIALISFLSFLFLYWRAGRHEFIESTFLFDVIFVSMFGAILFGRITDFVFRYDYYAWSLRKLIFVNVYTGFDYFGAFYGGIVSAAIYLGRIKRKDPLYVFDLATAPLAFSAALIALGSFLLKEYVLRQATLSSNLLYVYYSVGYFIIFWMLKRLEAKKRHVGFFASIFLVCFAVLHLLLMYAGTFGGREAEFITYRLLFPSAALLLGVGSWYFLSGRSLTFGIKSFFAFCLLGVFKLKRVLTNIREADIFAKSIIFFPYYLAKFTQNLVKLVIKEILLCFEGFFHILGFKK